MKLKLIALLLTFGLVAPAFAEYQHQPTHMDQDATFADESDFIEEEEESFFGKPGSVKRMCWYGAGAFATGALAYGIYRAVKSDDQKTGNPPPQPQPNNQHQQGTGQTPDSKSSSQLDPNILNQNPGQQQQQQSGSDLGASIASVPNQGLPQNSQPISFQPAGNTGLPPYVVQPIDTKRVSLSRSSATASQLPLQGAALGQAPFHELKFQPAQIAGADQNVFWLAVPGTTDSVLIQLRQDEQIQQPMLRGPKIADANFSYVTERVIKPGRLRPLPQGLRLWKSDFGKGPDQILRVKPGMKPFYMDDVTASYAVSFATQQGDAWKYDANPVHPCAVWNKELVDAKHASSAPVNNANAAVMPPLPRKNFVKNVIGMDECDFAAQLLTVPEAKRPAVVSKIITDAGFEHGTFRAHSIEQLRNATAALQPFAGPAQFNVIVYYGNRDTSPDSRVRAKADIGALQASVANNTQVASNFHCLEGGNDRDWLKAYTPNQLKGSGWNPYKGMLEHTTSIQAVQGEEARASAAPGFIWMGYGVPHDEADLMHDLRDVIAIDSSGGQNIDPTKLQQFIHNGEFDAKRAAQIRVGFHKGIQVTTGLINVNREQLVTDADLKAHWVPAGTTKHTCRVRNEHDSNALVTGPKKLVNQILTAGVCFRGQLLGKINPKTDPLFGPFGRAVSYASTEGTIRATAMYGEQDVHLTLVGCGAFRNPIEWIYEGLRNPTNGSSESMVDFIKRQHMQVTMVVYIPDNGAEQNLTPFLAELENNIVKDVGGTITAYTNDPDNPVIKTYQAGS